MVPSRVVLAPGIVVISRPRGRRSKPLRVLTVVAVLDQHAPLPARRDGARHDSDRVVEQGCPQRHVLLRAAAVELDGVEAEGEGGVDVGCKAEWGGAVVVAPTVVVICTAAANGVGSGSGAAASTQRGQRSDSHQPTVRLSEWPRVVIA